ncbi:MAG: hypothetical protein LBP62_05770, partial [Clostridiales bacterium]|nr:hypothetical protein [Clostridiales bacterium]
RYSPPWEGIQGWGVRYSPPWVGFKGVGRPLFPSVGGDQRGGASAIPLRFSLCVPQNTSLK